MNNQEILQNINRYTQALISDCSLLGSGDQLLATDARKEVTKATMQLVESNLAIIKKQLG